MSKWLRGGVVLTWISCSLVAQEGLRGHLADVQWLRKQMSEPNVLLLDASSTEKYKAAHIPGAVHANAYELFAYGFGGLSKQEAEEKLQSWGIAPGKKIVMYDEGGSNMATRLFFDLQYQGVPEKDLYILDGGLFKWQKEGLPSTKETSPVARSAFRITEQHPEIVVGTSEVVIATGDTAKYAVLDGLDANWHYGGISPFRNAGHIPNSILATDTVFYRDDKTFKSPEEVSQLLAFLGVKREQEVYTYCGGGVAATVPYFAAKYIAGYPKVKVYSASELGWLYDDRDLPSWTYDAPYLMRDTGWLRLWNGQMAKMIRTVLQAPTSVVDLRAADAYAQGHIPYSVNVPAELFRANAASPEKLATLLRTAGVNTNQEVVVVSGSGVTKDSALAFLLLEKLGHKKVSVFSDSMDRWAAAKQPVSKEPMLVETKMRDYPVAVREGVVVRDGSPTHGAYPRVYLASGTSAPGRKVDGKVVHVAYSEFVNPDGTLKAAKDIWATLEKAGVSRYAEIVCYSDDPSEAAVNYYALRLMGFPDVKVLI